MIKYFFVAIIFIIYYQYHFSFDYLRDYVISDATMTNGIIDPGRKLAIQYCEGCHIFPEPILLDKKTWTESVLPNMALRLGIRNNDEDPYKDLANEEIKVLKQINVYPDSPLISKQNWELIVQYYQQNAPDTPYMPKSNIAKPEEQSQFDAGFRTYTKMKSPKTTMVKIARQSSSVYIGDAYNEIFIVDSLMSQKSKFRSPTPPVDLVFYKNGKAGLLTIGSIMPSDQKQGHLTPLDAKSGYMFEKLARPVHTCLNDLNNDGTDDMIICEFGHHTGKLAWFDGANPHKEYVLSTSPGARKVEVRDFNRDNRADIMVLWAQANEGISIYYNRGQNRFREEKVLRLPPVYGVSYFELADFNGDGYEDILLTNGDNWDLSSVQKYYHGIRIYLNDGKNKFKEQWFFPLYGTSKAIARDFDKDGHLDLAAISFYADLEEPKYSFLFLKGQASLTFKSYYTQEAAFGKWLTMDAGDIDLDGDDDIILGSYFHNFNEMTKLMMSGVGEFPQLLVLKNKLK